MNPVWIASYPRSGNTFLRTVLNHCFGLKSTSVYPNDLGGNKLLENYVGHIEPEPYMRLVSTDNAAPLVKTHELPRDNFSAIYVIRDGRAACASLWEFYKGAMSLEQVIKGNHRFGTWAAHVSAWSPWDRPNTLLIKYESLINDFSGVLVQISEFLGRDILTRHIPDRNTIAGIDGQWVKVKKDWKTVLTGKDLERFNETNRDILIKTGYLHSDSKT